MAHFYLPKTPVGSMNFSVVNDTGERLSFAADDSCGAFYDRHARTYLARFSETGNEIESEILGVDPLTYLRKLADHLGYDIVKRER